MNKINVSYRKQIAEYLHTKMNSVAPNLTTLVGDQVGARLISKAGSLTSLAKYPASTLQILGKILFHSFNTIIVYQCKIHLTCLISQKLCE